MTKSKAKKPIRVIEKTGAKKQIDGGTMKVKTNKTKRVGKTQEKTGRVQELKETPVVKGKKDNILKKNVKHNGLLFKKGFKVTKDNCDYDALIKFC